MTRDNERYPDAAAFKPERFIQPDGQLTDDDHILAFGFGRRFVLFHRDSNFDVHVIYEGFALESM